MAQQQQNNGTQNMLTGGLWRDSIDMLKKENSYSYARNACVVISDGQRGAISAEQANSLCTTFPYTPIAFIYLTDGQWTVFMTDDINSEIGIFYEPECRYETLTKGSQPCLNFNKESLITGGSRRGFDCGFNVYWADGGRNPDRFINTAKVPWIQDCSSTPVGASCLTCVDTNILDCNRLRLAPELTIPCLELSKGQAGGTLPSAQYQVCAAYTINEIRCTDYFALSNPQAIFNHTGTAGGLRLSVTIDDLDENFPFSEMEIVIVSMANGQSQAKRLGTYSVRQSVIYIDDIDQTLPTVALSVLPISNPAVESSDAMYVINNYLTRIGSREQPDFNYQPLANQIQSNYAVIAYEEDYYHKGGSSERSIGGTITTYPMNVGMLRDEVYAYFVQWTYTTGEYSAAYHIPGNVTGPAPTYSVSGAPTVPGSLGTTCHGKLGVYLSEERYPDNQSSVWGALCGQRIRHHRFPAQSEFGPLGMGNLSHFSHPYPTSGGRTTNNVQVMAVYFSNIQLPVGADGVTPIPNIAGYRILRASREGHMSILAKGMVNSMRGFNDPYSGKPALYQNYPYNDLTPDYFLTSNYNTVRVGQPNTATNPSSDNFTDPLTVYRNDILSFHSPDTVFEKPALGLGTLKTEMLLQGLSTGYFRQSYKHGNFKTLTNFNSAIATFLAAVDAVITIVNAIVTPLGGSPPSMTLEATEDVPMAIPIYLDNNYSTLIAGSDASTGAKIAAAGANLAIYLLWAPIRFKVLQNQILTILKTFAPPRAFAWQWDSHGEYADFNAQFSSAQYNIQDYSYIAGNIQTFANMSVNNLWRNTYVALQLAAPIANIAGLEKSRYTMTERGVRPDGNDSVMGPWSDSLFSFYASYKVPQLTQYGQIGSTKNVPVSCVYSVDVTSTRTYTSPVIFGGDTYINRYTEKNPFYYFNDWLIDAPPDYEYNYRLYINTPYPRYWIDNTGVTLDILGIMSRLRHLDAQVNAGNLDLLILPPISTYVMNGAFYLFNNGVRDFYVESSINVGYRDWRDEIPKRFWDPYGFTDESLMFRSDYLKEDPNIYYYYDKSLSAGKFYNQYISWAQTLRRDYDPALAYTCFSYYPRKLLYSLPQEEEGRRDNWRMFLPNNYTNLPDKAVSVMSEGNTGAFILFENSSPARLPGVTSIPSQNGTEYSVGTGSLFSQPLQFISNAAQGMQYGSCQNRLSVINTPFGIFWVSRDAGKIFQYDGKLKDITNDGIKAWCALYLPSQMLAAIPDFPLADNPIAGVGIQTVYDSTNEVIYFCKKDYVPRTDLPFGGTIEYLTGVGFILRTEDKSTIISITDTNWFQPASWTISYDLKTQQWIGYHDWWPDLSLSSTQHFLTTKGQNVWRHNTVVDNYTTYYGVRYPFEIEVPITTGPLETTLSSVEFLLDSYRYLPNGVDKVQLFDGSWTDAMCYNPEQNTGIMPLTLTPFNDPFLALTYPISTATGPNILFDKVENRFRINNILDITRNRNRFGPALTPSIFTDNTGYRFSLNAAYFDVLKSPLEQKRLRYMNSKIWFRRSNNHSNSCSIRYISTRYQISRR